MAEKKCPHSAGYIGIGFLLVLIGLAVASDGGGSAGVGGLLVVAGIVGDIPLSVRTDVRSSRLTAS